MSADTLGFLNQNPTLKVELIFPEKSESDNSERMLSIRDRAVQAVAYILIALGTALLLATSGLIVSGILAGGGATLLLGESLIPTALIILMGGVHLSSSEKKAPKLDFKMGPAGFSYGG